MKSRDLRKKLFENSARFRKEFLKKDWALELGHLVVEERLNAGFTQKELAQKIKTKQPSIARIENGSVIPSIAMLHKIMTAFKAELVINVRREATSTFTEEVISPYFTGKDFTSSSRAEKGRMKEIIWKQKN